MAHKFAAVEVKPREHDIQGIEAFFRHADGIGLKFDLFEPFGRVTIGTTQFLRFRTDCPQMEGLIPFFQEESRAIIIPSRTGYRMITQTADGAVPVTVVQAAKLPGQNRRWRGTSSKFWKRQFPSP